MYNYKLQYDKLDYVLSKNGQTQAEDITTG